MEQLMWTDYILIIVIFLSTLLSIRKGFFLQIFSILSITIAIIIAFRYSGVIADLVNKVLGEGRVSITMVMAGVFFLCYTVLSKTSLKVSKKLETKRFALIDKLLGIFFGFVRGVIIAVIVVSLALFSPYVKTNAWLKTPLTLGLKPLSDTLLYYVPDEVEVSIKSQVKGFESSALVIQTKKLINASFDTDLDIEPTPDDATADAEAKSAQDEVKKEEVKPVKVITKTQSRFMKEASKKGANRPANLLVSPDDGSEKPNPLFKSNKRLLKSDQKRAALLKLQKKAEEEKRLAQEAKRLEALRQQKEKEALEAKKELEQLQ